MGKLTIAIKANTRRRNTPLPDSDLQVLSRFTRLRAWTLTGLATVALATTLVHRQVLAALAVTVTDALGISDVEYGWLSSGLAGAFLLGSLPGARLIQKIGPPLGMALTVVMTSIVIGLHSLVASFGALLLLRIAMGAAASLSMPAAAQTVHRVMPFKDRGRGIGLLYLGNSLGSAICPPIAIMLEARIGWRPTFTAVALIGAIWVPLWSLIAFVGKGSPNSRQPQPALGGQRPSVFSLASSRGVWRGGLLVAAAAPITLLMFIWAAKYLAATFHLPQRELGYYLWQPALFFGLGSLAFGELRSRSAKTRASARPPSAWVALAAVMCMLIAVIPAARNPTTYVVIASLAMLGAGGLYTLATSDMLAHIPRGLVASTAGFTTFAQSLVYITISPIIGKCAQLMGNYDWVLLGAGLWVLPLVLVWLFDAARD